jgi:lysophospholipase L1-like esterase
VNEWNDRVRAIAAAQQATLVDVHVAFNNDLTLLSPDGLHPNERGFERIADTFFQALRDTLEVPQ